MLKLPVRACLLGGWSDQVCWDGSAAVLNFSCGWDDGSGDPYPMRLHEDGRLETRIRGVGTGLGVSSIVAAGRFLETNRISPDGISDLIYVAEILKWEALGGIHGGWQDQIGGVEPGLKLITTTDHQHFAIQRRDNHPILDHLVLFDTGIRRNSGVIGARVRAAMKDREFRDALGQAVCDAHRALNADAEECARLCLSAWANISWLIPGLDPFVPGLDRSPNWPALTWGYKLCGAGGGGYGLYFVKRPEWRQELIAWLGERGMWAAIPVLLPGVQRVEERAAVAA